MRTFSIGTRGVGGSWPAYVIAEIGLNHNGSMDLAKQGIQAAAACGADAVKFQTFRTSTFITSDNPYYSVFANAEISEPGQLRELMETARAAGIEMFSSATDDSGLDLLLELGVSCIKFSSANITNLPLLRRAAKVGKPLIISTGASTFSEVAEAVESILEQGVPGLGVLACTSLYPCPPAAANVRKMRRIADAFPDVVVGYSDHTQGIVAGLMAVALGGKIVEKHFTTDRSLPGPDHHYSSDPAEFSALVKAIRDAEAMAGDSTFSLSREEEKMRPVIRRYVTAGAFIGEGERITADKLIVRRAARPGIEPKHLGLVVGRVARRDIGAGAAVTWDDI